MKFSLLGYTINVSVSIAFRDIKPCDKCGCGIDINKDKYLKLTSPITGYEYWCVNCCLPNKKYACDGCGCELDLDKDRHLVRREKRNDTYTNSRWCPDCSAKMHNYPLV